MIVEPQPGPQSAFLASSADIVVYGGAARGGKTFGLLMEPLRHARNRDFSAVLFRRTNPQITMSGGTWEEAVGIYAPLGAKFKQDPMVATFGSGMSVRFSHLQHDKTAFEYQGSKLPLILFDELTHFTESQFWYLRSRNTGTCGVKPYIRATCNPVSTDDKIGGWVNRLVSWWIDPDTGYAIPERSGVVRWFYRVGEDLEWYDSKEDARSANPLRAESGDPASFTFIPAKLDDNAAQLAADPNYRSVLMDLPLVERERLLEGNWKIRHEAGTVFKREWFTRFVDHCPWGDITSAVRYWDNAASDAKGSDSSAGVGMARAKDGRLYVFGVVKDKWTTHARRQAQASTAESDRAMWRNVELWLEQEGGSGGKDSTVDTLRELAPYSPRFEKPTTNKIARAGMLSAQAEKGNVYLVRAPWNHSFIEELCNFPAKGWHDDQVDGASGATAKLIGRTSRPSGGSSGHRAG